LTLLDQNECALPHEMEKQFFKDVEFIMEKMASLTEYYDKLGYDYGD